MKIYKNTLKIIFITCIAVILVSGISVYATYKYLAKDVSYVKSNGEELNVEEALNELYSKNKGEIEYYTFCSDVISTSGGTFYTKVLSIPEGKTKVYIYSSASSTYYVTNPTINSTIIDKCNTSNLKKYSIPGCIDSADFISIIETNGKAGNITISYGCGGTGKHFAEGILFYK